MSQELQIVPRDGGLAVGQVMLNSWHEIKEIAEDVSKTQMVPKSYQGRPGDIAVVFMMAGRLNADPFSALQGIAVINGRPALWGDFHLAVCQQDSKWDDFYEEVRGEDDARVAICWIKRKGYTKPVVGKFSVNDAKTAQLWGKQGPWSQYPNIMLKRRARSFALRDAFPGAAFGMYSVEEASDISQDYSVIQDGRGVEPDIVIQKDQPIKPGFEEAVQQTLDGMGAGFGEPTPDSQNGEPTKARATSKTAKAHQHVKNLSNGHKV